MKLNLGKDEGLREAGLRFGFISLYPTFIGNILSEFSAVESSLPMTVTGE